MFDNSVVQTKSNYDFNYIKYMVILLYYLPFEHFFHKWPKTSFLFHRCHSLDLVPCGVFHLPRSLRGISSPSFPAGYFISHLVPCGVIHLSRSLRGISSFSFPAWYFISLVPCGAFHLPRSLRGISSPSFPAGYFISLVLCGVFHLPRSLRGISSLISFPAG